MRDPAACIELCEAGIDLGQEDQPLDCVVERRVLRKILERLEYPLTSRWFLHDRILSRAEIAPRSYSCRTPGMKAAVSILDPVFKAADELAQRMGVSRSHLYSVAIQHFVQDHDDEAITAKLNEVYDNESSALDPVLQSIQARSLKKDDWK